MLHANITALGLIEQTNGGYCQLKFYIAGIGIFNLFGYCDLDLDP